MRTPVYHKGMPELTQEERDERLERRPKDYQARLRELAEKYDRED